MGVVMRSKEQLVEALKIVREQVCGYFPSSRCDCKYGLSENRIERDKIGRPTIHFDSEQTGCPELREVTYLLECMDDEDIQDVINKGKTAYGSNKDTESRDK